MLELLELDVELSQKTIVAFTETVLIMKESRKIQATRQLLSAQGDPPKQIKAVVNYMRASERADRWNEFRSWASVIISLLALVVSVLVSIYR